MGYIYCYVDRKDVVGVFVYFIRLVFCEDLEEKYFLVFSIKKRSYFFEGVVCFYRVDFVNFGDDYIFFCC